MSLGVGNRVNQNELQRIVTSPEGALFVNTLDDAIASIATVANATCLGKLVDKSVCVLNYLDRFSNRITHSLGAWHHYLCHDELIKVRDRGSCFL